MKFGFVFPGYSNQFVGMGKELYDSFRIVQENFEEASHCLDRNFVKLCFATSDSELSKLENAYIGLFLVSVSIANILKEHGVVPSIVAGRDIGEYGALAAINGMTLPDAVYLLRKYAVMYQEFLGQRRVDALRVRNLEIDTLQEVCAGCVNGNNIAHVSIYELHNQSIITGTIDAVKCVKKVIENEHSGPVEAMPVGGGLHSPLMDDILKSMKMYLEKVDFKDVDIPFVASVTGQALRSSDGIRAAVMQQVHAPLKWQKVLDAFAFCDVIITPGKGRLSEELLRKAYPDKEIISVTLPEDINKVLELAGKPTIPLEDDSDE